LVGLRRGHRGPRNRCLAAGTRARTRGVPATGSLPFAVPNPVVRSVVDGLHARGHRLHHRGHLPRGCDRGRRTRPARCGSVDPRRTRRTSLVRRVGPSLPPVVRTHHALRSSAGAIGRHRAAGLRQRARTGADRGRVVRCDVHGCHHAHAGRRPAPERPPRHRRADRGLQHGTDAGSRAGGAPARRRLRRRTAARGCTRTGRRRERCRGRPPVPSPWPPLRLTTAFGKDPTIVLTDLGITVPVLAAPMAGGPTTPELVVAAGRAGSMGFVAGGYRTPQALAEQITRVRGAGVPFGVNLFVPDRRPVSIEDLDAYRTALTREAARYGVTLPDAPTTDDDHWADKIALLLDDPVPVVSFTFGLPDRATVDALRAKGTLVVQTVTSPHEARLAEES